MTALEELLECMPPGSHIRIVKARRYPAWNPWCVIAYRHDLTGKTDRRGHPSMAYVEVTRANGASAGEAAAAVLSRLNVLGLHAISEALPETPLPDLPWDADGYDL